MTPFPTRQWKYSQTSWEVFLFVLLIALNGSLVSPYISWYDSGEMVGTTLCLGISHPSGQVLFHLLGKVFLLLPWGTPALKLGFLSAACSALASVLFFHLSCRLAGNLNFFSNTGKAENSKSNSGLPPRFSFFLLTLAWSLSLPWWRYSLVPLVYALHLALGFLLLWTLSLEKSSKWFLAAFILGISTVFRPTQFFAGPFVALAFLWEMGRPDCKQELTAKVKISQEVFGKLKRFNKPFWGIVLKGIAFFLLGRSTLLYLPLRSALHPAIAYADLTRPMGLFRHLFALKFSKFVGVWSFSTSLQVFRQMLLHFWNDLTPFGILLISAGVVCLYRWRPKISSFLWVGLGWGLLEAAFVFTIPYPTFESHQMLLGWAFSGFLAVLSLIAAFQLAERFQYRPVFITLLLMAFVIAQVLNWGHLRERQQERGAQDYARNILEIMDPHSLFIPTEENEYFPVAGYQQSFQFRKDVEVLEPGMQPSWVGTQIRQCLENGRSLYVTRKWTLPGGWSYEAWGPLLKVVPIPTLLLERHAPIQKPLALWGGLELLKAEITPDTVKSGGRIQILYQWVRRKPSSQDSTDMVVAVFIDRHGNYFTKDNVLWLHDIHEPPMGIAGQMDPGILYEKKNSFYTFGFSPRGICPGGGFAKKIAGKGKRGRAL